MSNHCENECDSGCQEACEGEDSSHCTLCNGDTTDNYWVEGGVCMLDQVDVHQITYILERNEKAREDLRRVTTNPELLRLADEIPRLDTRPEGDVLQKVLNDNTSLPFYTVFRGNYNNM